MGCLHPLVENAYKVLSGGTLERTEALALAENVAGADVLDLVSLANKVRHKFAPPFHRCSIVNAKSGKCGENCRFCAQSGHHAAAIETYPLRSPEEILKAAREVYAQGVRTFGYVTSGRGWAKPDADFRRILDTLDLLHRELPDLSLCVSLGILSEECVKLLAEHHVRRYNMNLQTNPAHYRELIADTHTIEDKIATIELMKKYGIANCTGGIFGLGETWADRVDMAFAVRSLKVDAAPLNVLTASPFAVCGSAKIQLTALIAPSDVFSQSTEGPSPLVDVLRANVQSRSSSRPVGFTRMAPPEPDALFPVNVVLTKNAYP